MYSPTLGRFMRTDPIGYTGGLNWYNYVGSDPVNFVDPTGLCTGLYKGPGADGKEGTPDDNYYHDDLCGGEGSGRLSPRFAKVPLIRLGGGGSEPQSGQCASPATSSAEAAAARAGNRDAYWSSRAARGDPLAATTLGIVRNNTALGVAANTILISAIVARNDAHPGRSTMNREVNQIGIGIMQAHVTAVKQLDNPPSERVAQYHFDVFADHGLPASTFGGAPITGSQTEAGLTSGIWMKGC